MSHDVAQRPVTTTPGWPRWLTLVGAFVGAVATCVVVVGLSGALVTVPLPGLPEPDTRVALLVALTRVVADLCAVLTVGFLLVAAVLLPGGGHLSPTGYRSMRMAGWWALGWGAAAIASIPATLADFLGTGLDEISLRAAVGFAWDLPQGQAQVAVASCAVAVAIGTRISLSMAAAMALLTLALIAALPPVFTGHATAADGHQAAISGLAIHVVGVLLWAGGLSALLVIRALRVAALSAAVHRYSRAAPWFVLAVGLSGVLTALTRLPSIEALVGTGYGRLVIAKAGALVVLVAIGWWHRRRSLPRLAAGNPGSFWQLAAGEVVLFAATIGLAVGLSRTPTPVPDNVFRESSAQDLLGYPMPGPISAARLLDVYPDPLFPLLTAVAVGVYLIGVRRLASRGVAWPVGRTVSWCLGWALVLVVTSSGLARYGQVLGSVHMIQHMTLSMAAPMLLVLAGPLTLALRAIRPSNSKGETGPREWLLLVLHSRFVRFLSNPLIALTLYLVSLYGMYFTGLYELSLRSHLAHLLVFLNFIVVGSLFFWLIIGIDPAPRRLPYPGRVLVLLLWIAFHTIFSLTLLQGTTLLAADWWAELDRPWGVSPLEDQRIGGGIAWGYGDLPILMIIVVLGIQWVRSDRREGSRFDRAVDRAVAANRPEDDPAAAYNARLRQLHEADLARASTTMRPRPDRPD